MITTTSSPVFNLTRQSLCPRGTRGGLLRRRWTRLQSSMTYTGAMPTFESFQPTTPDSIDLDVLEHFELPEQFQTAPAEPLVASPSKYSLAIPSISTTVPTAVRSFAGNIRSQSFKHIFESFKDLHHHGFIKYLTGSDFSNILIAANPKRIFPVERMARKIVPGTVPDANPYNKVYKRFWSDLNFILENMILSGHQPTVLDYTGLMGKAMWTQSKVIQESFWNRMLKQGLKPNTWTYNTRLAMVAGVRPANSLEKFPLVHTEQYVNHWMGREKNAVTDAMAIYAELLKNGLYPNSMTVELLIMAHARVGDIPGISKILRNVYGIKIDGDNGTIKPIIPKGSPVFPTSRTLKALAVAYCRNSQFSAALQAVEFLSRAYGLKIDEKTWDVLLTYSYAFSRPKYGLLPTDATSKLWAMMQERTQNAEPSLQARDIVIRSLTRSDDPEELELAEKEIRKGVMYFRTNVHQKYMTSRERWVNMPAESSSHEGSELWRLEKIMDEQLYNVCMWKDAMGHWLYSLARAHWDRTKRHNLPIAEFETIQINILEEFGAYWHDYRPVFEKPKSVDEKKVVPERVMFRTKYPISMAGLKGFPAM
ncbi:hypothetical protein TWF481_001070 [Arthrobotrys musiformis]|uniref:ATPase expression protein 2, mitochondrial n=1 Tax=Arthrobotrys musiformis TaxID=47236 RepID=A0AAV9WQC4_9PEZI